MKLSPVILQKKSACSPGVDMKVIKTCIGVALLVATLFVPGAFAACTVVPYTSDANTVLLDHLDGSTSASINAYSVGSGCSGTPWTAATPSYAYGSGQSGLGQAITMSPPAGQPAGSASYLRYSTQDILCQANGTIEFWVYPTAYSLSLADQGQYYNSCWGWTFRMGIDASGHLTASDWDGSGDWGGGLTSSQIVPLNTWSHVAVTWGSAGVKLYLNGVQVGSYSSTHCPASGYGGYLLMPCGTSAGVSCTIDELRISNVQRTSFNLCAMTATKDTPNPTATAISAPKVFKVVGDRFVVPKEFVGTMAFISVYNLSGKKLGRIAIGNNRQPVDLTMVRGNARGVLVTRVER